ncbi:hypothetical protein M404DRAFT_1006848 [Pisolithus tinctorius Marx 270]|uniref:Uncharacterized protein n=1 Tax=Pisolithus tinctorius Marx 270 TaxID=870435 RepID=A0A0C3N582_PISTI|nr:hypothetical protein M404DRAFT_1006848 [Pisolithus tinctorius Marx 270]
MDNAWRGQGIGVLPSFNYILITFVRATSPIHISALRRPITLLDSPLLSRGPRSTTCV